MYEFISNGCLDRDDFVHNKTINWEKSDICNGYDNNSFKSLLCTYKVNKVLEMRMWIYPIIYNFLNDMPIET